ncbi:hypothetical protein CLAFUW4_14711 [Fulvia fulva]|uniref:Uncharacterized protein n=1 Tax=Passalora fulva TaxID=5499 RepID=A0A9Q8PMI1_PASFU|nr:uncharacterized protein CLAFUR5_14538 [Fulvia fulva]KAK4608962.1 hypothetical protein CLAFUR4_14703 [Fulvia fulva]KAK4609728.1 hypothetical protein CLAFUR0_14703 [Fulvia fulva]UJO25153.1 hypothetical protein CLAFUR5_14538 [Fulvia fulva]WPV22477.1 hypothetical protein CLAFUW4_14711 [Fulvia fulva]WPV37607.1 hypothetical protein CLAFUW7_14712 [Fulvia fulva]
MDDILAIWLWFGFILYLISATLKASYQEEAHGDNISGYWYSDENTIMEDATACMCQYYKNRNTGGNQWDTNGWHLGRDKMHYYCTEKCGAEWSAAN